MPKGEHPADPRGLILEAYRMELGPEDCRTIFLDWALGLPEAAGEPEIAALLAHYGPAHPDHPMTAVLRRPASSGRPAGAGGAGTGSDARRRPRGWLVKSKPLPAIKLDLVSPGQASAPAPALDPLGSHQA